MTLWDPDGSGPLNTELVACMHSFYVLGEGYPIQIRRYDGRAWRPIGEPLWSEGGFPAKAMLDVGTSGVGSPLPGLYAAGRFDRTSYEPALNIVHWDGARWRPFGEPVVAATIYSLAMFDEDGSGPGEASLFVGGKIIEVDGITKPGVVRWDGSSYSTLGGGLLGFAGTNPGVYAMLVFDDDGSGPNLPALYAGGGFEFINGVRNRGPARWTGTKWETLGDGLGYVQDLAVYDADGDGPEPPMLYAGGGYSATNQKGEILDFLARWNGVDWEPVPGWIGGSVAELGVFDRDADGPEKEALIISGYFRTFGTMIVDYIMQWDGDNYRPMRGGLYGLTGSHATDMQVFDEDNDPSTPDGLYVGGQFFGAGGISAPGFARWGCPNPVCFADCDESTGINNLDIFDFLCFQTAFVNSDPYACDCDMSTGPATCDIFDFLCYQDAFVSGCP